MKTPGNCPLKNCPANTLVNKRPAFIGGALQIRQKGDIMTSRESYIMGWVCGIIQKARDDSEPVNFQSEQPYLALEKSLSLAAEAGLFDGELKQKVGEALGEIRNYEPETENGAEKAPTPELQGSWKIGYMVGLSGGDLPKDEFDIAAARKQKKITQTQLAALMGVDRALVSRWESGKVRPNDKNFKKLKELLS